MRSMAGALGRHKAAFDTFLSLPGMVSLLLPVCDYDVDWMTAVAVHRCRHDTSQLSLNKLLQAVAWGCSIINFHPATCRAHASWPGCTVVVSDGCIQLLLHLPVHKAVPVYHQSFHPHAAPTAAGQQGAALLKHN